MTLRTDCYSIIPFTGYLSIAHLVEWRTVAPTLLIILRSLVRFQLEAGVGCFLADFLMVQMVNCLPTRREILVQSLGQEDPLQEVMGYPLQYSWVSLVAKVVKNLLAMQ